ncbi:MAG: hypothetical protein HQM12_18305 [SAR324 cluster bacterium]|nr:hypothetical protein [SAR324 cluster bacterium]
MSRQIHANAEGILLNILKEVLNYSDDRKEVKNLIRLRDIVFATTSYKPLLGAYYSDSAYLRDELLKHPRKMEIARLIEQEFVPKIMKLIDALQHETGGKQYGIDIPAHINEIVILFTELNTYLGKALA